MSPQAVVVGHSLVMVKTANHNHKHSTALARSLALGHFVEKAIKQGKIRSHATAAGMLGVTRNRVSQIVCLTFLAPDIQEEILFMRTDDPLANISEKVVRQVVACHRHWNRQRQWWLMLKNSFGTCAVPLGVCSIAQLQALHVELLGAAAPSDEREILVKALGEWILEQVRATDPENVSEDDARAHAGLDGADLGASDAAGSAPIGMDRAS